MPSFKVKSVTIPNSLNVKLSKSFFSKLKKDVVIEDQKGKTTWKFK